MNSLSKSRLQYSQVNGGVLETGAPKVTPRGYYHMNASLISFDGAELQLGRRTFIAGGIIASAAVLGLNGADEAWAAQTEEAGDALTNVAAALEGEPDDTVTTKFLIVGSGIAGCAAAVEAKQLGLQDVILIEKNDILGGNTNFAEGIFATHSRYQQEQGIPEVDGSQVLAEESAAHHYINHAGLMKRFIDASSDNVNWLMDQGVSFVTVEVETCGGKCLHIYEGGNGASAIQVLSTLAIDEYGLDVRTGTRATALLLDDDGSVRGIRAQDAQGRVTDFLADTVLLATGGVASNDEMMDVYTKMQTGKYSYVGMAGSDGDGLRLAEATAMGRAKNVCAMNMWLNVEGTVIKSVANYIGGSEGSNIWVNERGVRFVNEAISGNPATLIDCNNAVQSQGRAYAIFDAEHVEFFKENGTTADWSGFSPSGEPQPDVQQALDEAVADESVGYFRADTIEELAEAISVDADALAKTLDAWNAAVQSGEDAEFGKEPGLMFPVATPPFYAAHLQNGVLTTVGGIRVDEDGRVCSPAGDPVGNLYAAGVCCSGFTGENYSMAAPGTAQGSGVFLGRLAAQAAVAKSL